MATIGKIRCFNEIALVGIGALTAAKRHPVEAGSTPGGRLAAQRLVIEVGMQVGQDRALRLDPGDPGQRLVEIEMARMRRLAQRVDDPDVEAGQRRDAFGRQALDVGGIGHVAEAEAERGDVAVLLQDRQGLDRAALPLDGDRLARHQPLLGQRSADIRCRAASRSNSRSGRAWRARSASSR